MKFREKWFWALCLAILVHAGAFLVFYLNANQTDAVEMADSSMSTAEPTAVSDVTLSPNDKVYTTTVTSTKSLDNIDNTLDKVDNYLKKREGLEFLKCKALYLYSAYFRKYSR